MDLNLSELGKKSDYKTKYDKELLFPIPRQIKRDEIGIEDASYLFSGYDLWTAFEVSWLNEKGKPIVKIVKFILSSNTENIIESKSFKLYLNSFNNTKFNSDDEVLDIMKKDIAEAANGDVVIEMYSLDEYSDEVIDNFNVTLLDNLDCEVTEYETNAQLLKLDKNFKEEVLTEAVSSHLLKSNCLVTGQPDWGSVLIEYTGAKIDHESLLKYLISFRNHNEFHEQCVERIFTDILRECKPEKLMVYARYTRRGGLDINPLRSNYPISKKYQKIRLNRQ